MTAAPSSALARRLIPDPGPIRRPAEGPFPAPAWDADARHARSGLTPITFKHVHQSVNMHGHLPWTTTPTWKAPSPSARLLSARTCRQVIVGGNQARPAGSTA
jgi:hypothetical protein